MISLFETMVSISGGLSFTNLEGIPMSSVLSDLSSNDNNYSLALLHMTAAEADFDWTNDNADLQDVSYLYDNLVVKSDADWTSRDDSVTIDQEIRGDIIFDNSVDFQNVTLASGVFNQGRQI